MENISDLLVPTHDLEHTYAWKSDQISLQYYKEFTNLLIYEFNSIFLCFEHFMHFLWFYKVYTAHHIFSRKIKNKFSWIFEPIKMSLFFCENTVIKIRFNFFKIRMLILFLAFKKNKFNVTEQMYNCTNENRFSRYLTYFCFLMDIH